MMPTNEQLNRMRAAMAALDARELTPIETMMVANLSFLLMSSAKAHRSLMISYGLHALTFAIFAAIVVAW